MTYPVDTVEEYIASLPEDRVNTYLKLRKVISQNLPSGFIECLSCKFPAFPVPHSLYPPGYHCRPEEPLPFISLASQKHFIGFYHMGIYVLPDLKAWFKKEYLALGIGNPGNGANCIRPGKTDKIPFPLFG